jgi:hypothetical protein
LDIYKCTKSKKASENFAEKVSSLVYEQNTKNMILC